VRRLRGLREDLRLLAEDFYGNLDVSLRAAKVFAIGVAAHERRRIVAKVRAEIAQHPGCDGWIASLADGLERGS
jgi:hypothetical protein